MLATATAHTCPRCLVPATRHHTPQLASTLEQCSAELAPNAINGAREARRPQPPPRPLHRLPWSIRSPSRRSSPPQTTSITAQLSPSPRAPPPQAALLASAVHRGCASTGCSCSRWVGDGNPLGLLSALPLALAAAKPRSVAVAPVRAGRRPPPWRRLSRPPPPESRGGNHFSSSPSLFPLLQAAAVPWDDGIGHRRRPRHPLLCFTGEEREGG
jgi:hypothetical protein